MRTTTGDEGFGLIEILIVLVVVAACATLLYWYAGSTARTVETLQQQRPVDTARLTADQATVSSLRSGLQAHYAAHGRWPADKAEALALLPAPPRFQCAGNDIEYDPATGQVRLLVEDPTRC